MTPEGAASKSTRASTDTGSMLSSYTGIAHALVENLAGTALLDARLGVRGQTGPMRGEAVALWLRGIPNYQEAAHHTKRLHAGDSILVIPIRAEDGGFLGAFCAQLAATRARADAGADAIVKKLQPVIDSLTRELAHPPRGARKPREHAMSDRTHELEWLFKITQRLQGANDDRRVLEQLLEAATKRMRCVFGAMVIPDKRLSIQHLADDSQAAAVHNVFEKNRHELLAWVQRKNRALVINGATHRGVPATCKILAVPVLLSTGRVIGLLTFMNPGRRSSFEDRHTYLARHLGRQVASLIEAQFDLMTGLYSRAGLEQAYLQMLSQAPEEVRSVVYVDVDRTHVVNELHGFELGNELIVRVAGLLGAPTLPETAVCARLSGDRFAVVLSQCDALKAVEHATQLRQAVARVVIGPDAGFEVSISCGVADLVDIPQGLARALAAAEIACKAAKDRGRDRVEVYAAQDSSIMRRKDDVAAVGRLRTALRTNSLVLFAQRIAPLQRPDSAGGYEILMRLQAPDGTLTSPGPTIAAAQRYQLLPSVDRWVTQRAFEMLAPYRAMLRSSGLYMSINISGQSLGDEAFAQHFTRHLREAALPAGSVGIEVTEQAAVTNLAHAGRLIEALKAAGCRIALDDFGTGANTLAQMKSLQVGCLKIDGIFVRDLLTNTKSRGSVRGIVELAKACQMSTVAEFVETEEIAAALKKLGVDYAQGYAFGQPQPLDELLAMLGRDESARLHKLFLED